MEDVIVITGDETTILPVADADIRAFRRQGRLFIATAACSGSGGIYAELAYCMDWTKPHLIGGGVAGLVLAALSAKFFIGMNRLGDRIYANELQRQETAERSETARKAKPLLILHR